LPDEEHYLGDFLFDLAKIPSIAHQIRHIYIYHSKDDLTCPYAHAERLSAFLPDAKLLTFEDRGHFKQEDFPELLANVVAIS
jgi:pimeloyl-ACP methyl ester carboxylesterase